MMIVKIKICGLTSYEDAKAAVDMGADLLGFNFYPKSPRYVDAEKAAEIISRLAAFVDTVGVFVNSELDEIRDIMDCCQLNWVQLHGDEGPEFVEQFMSLDVKTIKAIRVRERADIDRAGEFRTDAILFDAFDSEAYGGTGKKFDWNVVGDIQKRVFLAGGINPSNVAEAVQTGVYGIDVCSGIESLPGKKDHRKMKKLFENVKHLRA